HERQAAHPTPAPAAPAPPVAASPSPGAPAAEPRVATAVRDLDGDAFAKEVGPVLVKSCATSGCHGPPNGAGELVLEPLADAGAAARDLEAVRRFVVPGYPERSALLTKALRRDEGGEGHGGGDVLSRSSPTFETL